METWERDVDLEGAAFVGGTDGARDGSDVTSESVAFGADSDARCLHVSGAFLKLFLNTSEVYHLLRFGPSNTRGRRHRITITTTKSCRLRERNLKYTYLCVYRRVMYLVSSHCQC